MAENGGSGDRHESPMASNMSVLVFDNNSFGRPKSVKRPRPVKSCTECRKRKLKCDRLCPCSQCQKSRRDCKYAFGDMDGGSDGSENELPDRPVKQRRNVSNGPSAEPTAPGQLNGAASSTGRGTAPMDDVAARLDRLERLIIEKNYPPSEERKSSRRHHHPHVPALAVTIRAITLHERVRTRYFGQYSTKVLLNLFPEAKDFMNSMARTDGVRDLFVALQRVYKALEEDHLRLLEPIGIFVDSMIPVQKRMSDILPKRRESCDRLLEAYIGASEGLYRVVHLPTFREEYERYWRGEGHNDAFLPRLLCMMSIGSRFETESRGLGHDRHDSVHAPTALALVRTWLDGLRGKYLVDYQSLQTEILLLHAQRTITLRNQESWAQMGLIVRMAMTMGFHRDPSESPQIPAFCGENRRKIWYTIMDMDLHIALQCSLPCAVREGEYTCRPPRNLDDGELFPEMRELPGSKPIETSTSNQMQSYAANTLSTRMRVAHIVNRLDTIRDHDEVLDVGMKLEQMIDDVNALFPRHYALDTQQKYKEWRFRVLLDMHVRRPLLALYRPFAMGTTNCPPHIMNSYLKSSMTILTYMDELDPSAPGFQDVVHMYLVILKHDIIQAAFSVCYFIKIAQDATVPGQWRPSASPGLSETSSQDYQMRPMWSTATLIRTVEKTLDSLIGLIKDSTSDLRDIVALSVVLSSVQAGTAEQRFERIANGIQRILDTCMESLQTKPGGASIPLDPILTGAPARRQPQDVYLKPSRYSSNDLLNEPAEEFRLWDHLLDSVTPTNGIDRAEKVGPHEQGKPTSRP